MRHFLLLCSGTSSGLAESWHELAQRPNRAAKAGAQTFGILRRHHEVVAVKPLNIPEIDVLAGNPLPDRQIVIQPLRLVGLYKQGRGVTVGAPGHSLGWRPLCLFPAI